MDADAWQTELTRQFDLIADAHLMAPLDIEPDLRPQPDSPLIDAATESRTTTDIDGRPRPLGAAPDIGAYELP